MNEKEYKTICKKYRKRFTLVGARHIGEMENVKIALYGDYHKPHMNWWQRLKMRYTLWKLRKGE